MRRAATRDPQHDLITQTLPMVYAIAAEVSGRYDQDLVQEGCLGLIAAAERYDPTYGVKFSTFATFRIRGKILDELAARGKRRAREDSIDVDDDTALEPFIAVDDNGYNNAEWSADGPVIRAAFNAILDQIPNPRDHDIMRRLINGETCLSIANAYGITEGRVSQIRGRFTRIIADQFENTPILEHLKVA